MLVFLLGVSAPAWADSPDWRVDGDVESGFGWSVSSAGDVNGDGFGDVIVGAPSQDQAQPEAGGVFAYYGSAEGLAAERSWSAAPAESGNVGRSVSTAGDVNGDGFADVIVGAPLYSNGELSEGGVFVYHGSAVGLETNPAWSAESNQDLAQFGVAVSDAGDVNGDGFDDVIVGANWYNIGPDAGGGAFVYQGSPGGLEPDPASTIEAERFATNLGGAVSGAGDVNADGFDDVVVAATGWRVNVGRVYLYLGSAAGLEQAPAWTADGPEDSAFFGSTVSGAGDLNSDGFADIAVTFAYAGNGQTAVRVYLGSDDGLGVEASWEATTEQPLAGFGSAVSAGGDVNRDGFGDLLVGAVNWRNPEDAEGAVFLFHGSAAGLVHEAAWIAESDEPGAYAGHSVSSAGDVNGDGYDDVLAGAVGAEAMFAYYGTCDADGMPCIGGVCRDGGCDEAHCRIDGTWFDDGAPNPTDECVSCSVAVSRVEWSPGTDGMVCDAGLCRAGVCDPASCWVDGEWFDDGDVSPDDDCQVCSSPVAQTVLTEAPDGTPCDDGIDSTSADTCRGGACQGAEAEVDAGADASTDRDPDSGPTPGHDGGPTPDGGTKPREGHTDESGCACGIAARRDEDESLQGLCAMVLILGAHRRGRRPH